MILSVWSQQQAKTATSKPTSTAGTSGSHRFLDCQLSALVWEQTHGTQWDPSSSMHPSCPVIFGPPNIYTSTPLDKFSRVPPMRIWMMFLDLGSELYHRTATTRQQTSFKKTHAAVWAVGHISSSAPTAHGKLNPWILNACQSSLNRFWIYIVGSI